jgi:TolB-like protein/Tfp pilus assembly protein PilF
VLPFANMSDDKANESFSDGISEELGVVLSKVPGLRVAGWNSALSFKGKNVPEAEIAQGLGVTHIVSGSVRSSGTELRITARLVNAADGSQLWTDSFKREPKDIFAVQDEIAGLIAESLKLKLGVEARRSRAVNPEAHRLVLEGRHFWNQRNEDGFTRAEAAFLKAIEIDPTFPEAHVGLAGVYVIRGTYQNLEDTAREVTEDFRRARTAATTAVKLGPDLAEAHAVLGYTLFNQGEKTAAVREFERALALNPNSAVTVTWSSVMETLIGRLDAALGSYAKAAALDPLWFINLHLYAESLFFASRYDEALKIAERAAALRSDNFIPNLGLRAQILFALGRRAEGVAMARTVRTQLHRDTRWIADAHAIYVLRQCGEVKEAADYAAEALRQLEAKSPMRAPIFAALGSFDDALPTIGGTRITMRRYLYWEPIWDPWRNDPRFLAALAQLGCAEDYKTARETLARLKAESAAKK